MLTTLVLIRAFIPRITVSKIKHGDLEVLLKASRTYSKNISITKRILVDKSMTIKLADILETIDKMSKPAAQIDDWVRPLLMHTFKKQVDITLALISATWKMQTMMTMCVTNTVTSWEETYGTSSVWMHWIRQWERTTQRHYHLKDNTRRKLVFQCDYISKSSQMIFQRKPRQTKEKSI